MAHTQKAQANPSTPEKSLIREEPTTRSSIPMETRRGPSYSMEHEPYRTLKKTAFAPRDSRKYGDLPAPQPMPRLCLCWTFSQSPRERFPVHPRHLSQNTGEPLFSSVDKTFWAACPEACLASHLTQMVCVFTHKHTRAHTNRSCCGGGISRRITQICTRAIWNYMVVPIRGRNLIPPQPSSNHCPENSVGDEM